MKTFYNRPYFRYPAIVLGVLLSFVVVFSIMQNAALYKYSLGVVSKNYVRDNGNITRESVPFNEVTNSRLLHWDAAHYFQIMENGYANASKDNIFLYAFFPLFSFVWGLFHLSPLGISLLNFFMFAISAFILMWLYTGNLQTKDSSVRLILTFCTPMLVVFMIPYTEALFMLTLCIGIWGLLRNNYIIYFVGFMLAAMTRSAVTILLISFIATTVIYTLRNHSIRFAFFDLTSKILPAIVGTFLVMLYQYSTGSGKLLVFVDAIKTWETQFGLYLYLRDWSHESFSIVMGIMCLVIPIIIIYLTKVFLKSWKNIYAKENSMDSDSDGLDQDGQLNRDVSGNMWLAPGYFKKNYTDLYNKEYLLVFSMFYTLGVFLTIYLFKGGSMNGIARYVLCSPFFYVILYSLLPKIESVNLKKKIWIFTALTLLCVIVCSVMPYGSRWTFSDVGLLVFLGFTGLWIFYHHMKYRTRYLLLILLFVLSMVWNAYLLNMFLSNAWIFT